MKFSVIICLVILNVFSPSLTKVRENYKNAFNSKEVTLELNEELSNVSKKDNKILVAYKGAVLTLIAKHTKGAKEKKAFFKEGATLLDFAVLEKPTNVEIRCIRLGVQENSPKILKYKSYILEDKEVILTNFKNISSKQIKSFVRGYILQSKSFTEEEKKMFN